MVGRGLLGCPVVDLRRLSVFCLCPVGDLGAKRRPVGFIGRTAVDLWY